MSTRSLIGHENPDGTVTYIYCHFDGYVDHNGAILNEHYADPAKVRELVALGSISVLAPEIGVKHPFDKPYRPDSARQEYEAKYGNMVLAYHRDRGEDWERTKPLSVTNASEFFETSHGTEYWYLMDKDGGWKVKAYDEQPEPLADAVARIGKDEDDEAQPEPKAIAP